MYRYLRLLTALVVVTCFLLPTTYAQDRKPARKAPQHNAVTKKVDAKRHAQRAPSTALKPVVRPGRDKRPVAKATSKSKRNAKHHRRSWLSGQAMARRQTHRTVTKTRVSEAELARIREAKLRAEAQRMRGLAHKPQGAAKVRRPAQQRELRRRQPQNPNAKPDRSRPDVIEGGIRSLDRKPGGRGETGRADKRGDRNRSSDVKNAPKRDERGRTSDKRKERTR
jgi:hypothetical protein